MKTYEETLICVLRKAAEREKQNEKKKKRLSLITAVAAALILLTAIPVGSVMIANRAGEPIDTAEMTTAANTEKTPDENAGNEEFIVDFSASEKAVTDGEPVFYGQTEIYLDGTDERAKETEDGYLRYVKAMCVVRPSSEYEYYQADIVYTDGEVELYHITHKDKQDYDSIVISFDFDLLIPDEIEYGEVHFYFNLLSNGTETVEDYALDPYGECCLNFAHKYERLAVSYGQKTPEVNRNDLITGLNINMRENIYWIVSNLYGINETSENVAIYYPTKYEENLRLKKLYEKILISYREENEEEYAGIIQEFIERSPKVYDKDGKLDHINWRHDPLEDMNKNAT